MTRSSAAFWTVVFSSLVASGVMAQETVVSKGDPLEPHPDARAEVEQVIRGLDDNHLESAKAAADRLTSNGSPFATKRILEVLQGDLMIEVRKQLAEGLPDRWTEEDSVTNQKLWDLMIDTLRKERSTEVQEPMVIAVATYPDNQVASDQLIKFYPKAKNDEVRIRIIEKVGELGADGALEFLVRGTRSPYGLPRLTAVMAIYNHDQELALELTVKMLHKDDFDQNRIAAIKKLAEFDRDDLAAEIAHQLLVDQSWYVRRAALEGIKKKPTSAVASALCKCLLNDPKEDIRVEIPPIMVSMKGKDFDAIFKGAMARRRKREKNPDVQRRLDWGLMEISR